MASVDELIANIPDGDLVAIVESIQDGSKTPGESLGFGPEALNAVERMALSYYRGKKYGQAATLYGFVLRMDHKRGSAWRGLGACCQVSKNYAVAARCYEAAVRWNKKDAASRVFWGECLCLADKREEGLALLKKLIAEGSDDPRYKPYVTRAKAIVNAKGGRPGRLVFLQKGQEAVLDAIEMLDEIPSNGTREMTADDIRRDPRMAAMLADLTKAMGEGRLTLADVGGFTKNELDGGYAAASQYAQMGRVAEAMQIAGYLALVDPYNGRYFQLIAVCWQRMKNYDVAEQYYKIALVLDPDNPRTLCFMGECQLLTGKVEAGLALVRKGAERAAGKRDYADVAKRAAALLAQVKV